MANKQWIKNWFSNMLPCDEPFTYRLYWDHIEYKTVENFYQAMKANSDRQARDIAAMSPFQAKNYWRNHIPYPLSEQDKLTFMEYGLRQKFAPGTSWFKKLMETGDEEIIEFNNWGDRYWGIDVRDGEGENHLGKILMKIREEFKDADDKKRLEEEIREAIEKAGGDYGEFDLDIGAMAALLVGFQNNGIDVWRNFNSDDPDRHRKLHVSYNPPVTY